jgi:hypothetical protein
MAGNYIPFQEFIKSLISAMTKSKSASRFLVREEAKISPA